MKKRDDVIFADQVNNAVGSAQFIISQSTFLVLYLLFQHFAPVHWRFDPYPFILLNLLLSFQAAYTGPFVLWSQNRAAVRDRKKMNHIENMDSRTAAIVKKMDARSVKQDKDIDDLKNQLADIRELLESRRLP